MSKTLILSVGGSLSPLICSIHHHEPENIIFFTSTETEPHVQEILRRVGLNNIRNTEKIVTESPEDINLCLKAILSKLPEILARWKTDIQDIIVDYTGGTKPMSSALVLGTIHYTKCFSYIGAKDERSRNKNGIGVVVDGQEKVIILENPWDELALEEKKKICFLFNSGRYFEAKQACDEAATKASERQRSLFIILKRFSEAYHKWDAFDYKPALHDLRRAIHQLEDVCSQLPDRHGLVGFLENARENERFLKTSEELKKEEFRLLDLLANARRRARLEHRYDDALVRLYRALEKRAQMELGKYGLEASDINLALVPSSIREEIRSKYYNERKGKIEVSLYAAYSLLKALEEEKGASEIGHRFFEYYETLLVPVIDQRNKSIIVHGDVLIDEDKFYKAWGNSLQFLQIDENLLPQFPHLKF
ncbi:MAG: TIGR02710 family CRISPR-associated CARF protein [Clostridiales bacterium]|nr:TIGR02710 family CRISPR-associated CARF protein [Clostridiales bacterium]